MTGNPLTNRPRSVASSSEALRLRPTRPRQRDLDLALPTTRRAASRVPRTLLALKALKVLKARSGLMARPALLATSPVERLVVSLIEQRELTASLDSCSHPARNDA